MELNELPTRAGEWLKGSGPDSDIVIASRIRLARNMADYPFSSRASAQQKEEISALLKRAIMDGDIGLKLVYYDLNNTAELDRYMLVERHLISKEHANGDGSRGVIISRNEILSIMINEEDHLRIQVLQSGLQLTAAWEAIDRIDDVIDHHVSYAFSEELGYLTACPTNVGTGMRASVMLHLPALGFTKQIDKVMRAINKMNLAVRGLYGEGTQFSGSFYQISNQVTLGKSEAEILDIIGSTVPRIIEYERRARQALLAHNRERLEDKIWRALGVLKNTRTICSDETIDLLSYLRLGINLGIVDNLDMSVVNQLFVLTLPAHLQKLDGRELSAPERDIARAKFIRRHLGQL